MKNWNLTSPFVPFFFIYGNEDGYYCIRDKACKYLRIRKHNYGKFFSISYFL